MTAKVFICYRRDDSAGHAGRVQDRLEREFGRDLLFMDVDAIPLGVNFSKVLREEVAKCGVLLAVIGPNWLDARDKNGNRRLDDPNDFVHIEIAAALQRDIPVIPILLDGARIPKADQLPKDLEELALRNGLDVRHASFHNDMEKLIRGLKGQLQDRQKIAGSAAKEEQRRSQQQVKPWLLPLIGAVVAALTVLFPLTIELFSSDPRTPLAWEPLALFITALYGGAAGLLVQRFDIPRAVAIPAIPAILLLLFVFSWTTHDKSESWIANLEQALVVIGWSCAFISLTFYLHSLWVRKQQTIGGPST